MNRLLHIVLAFCAFAILPTLAYAGSVRYVDDDAPLGGDGMSWNTAYRHLQDAFWEAAAPNGPVFEIRVAQGTYQPDQDEGGHVTPGDRAAAFQFVSDLLVRGGYAGVTSAEPDDHDPETYETILSGDLAGNDASPSASPAENSYHVLTAAFAQGVTIEGLTVTAGFADGPDENGAGLRCADSQITLHACRFASNTADDFGGAIHAAATQLIATQCTFDDNGAADSGGGIYLDGGGGIWLNCSFTGNTTLDDGGAAVVKNADLLVSGCEFIDSICQRFGGAIHCLDSSVEFDDCSFLTNAAFVSSGGGISVDGGNVAISKCSFTLGVSGSGGGAVAVFGAGETTICDSTFLQNCADSAGAVSAAINTIVDIDNCTFTANETGDGRGGAMTADGSIDISNSSFVDNSTHLTQPLGGAIENLGDLTLINSTIVNNHADAGAGGVRNLGQLDVSNCILWGNTDSGGAGGEPAQLENDGGAVLVNYSCIEGLTGAFGGVGNIGLNPLFVNPVDDLQLAPGSPCIDASDNSALSVDIITDLAGNPRFIDDPATKDTGAGKAPIVDMGAYEFQINACLADISGDGAVGPADLSIILGNWGPVPPGDASADLTGDGVVNAADLAIVLGNWGPCP